MKVLVAVSSKHGSTREIAQMIAGELHGAGLAVDLREVIDVSDLAGYDAVVLGCAIYAGGWLPEARHFAARCHIELARLPLWVFSSGPLGADDPQPHDDLNKLAAPLAGVTMRDHRTFVGKLAPSELGVAEWLIAKAVRAPAGDFRDWEAIRAWAQGIGAALMQEQPASAS